MARGFNLDPRQAQMLQMLYPFRPEQEEEDDEERSILEQLVAGLGGGGLLGSMMGGAPGGGSAATPPAMTGSPTYSPGAFQPPSVAPTGGPAVTQGDFAGALLSRIGAPRTPDNVAAMLAWIQAEGEPDPGFNPLHTTIGGGAPTQQFPSFRSGVQATADTLLDNPQYYGGILGALRSKAPAEQVLSEVQRSPWAAGNYGGGLLSTLGGLDVRSEASAPLGYRQGGGGGRGAPVAPGAVAPPQSHFRLFPVQGAGVGDIISGWGDPRDGGARMHEGVDIQAPMGTPIVAPFRGRFEPTTDSLGGLSFRLQNRNRGGIYGAHLAGYAGLEPGSIVGRGDVLGYVGDTGNAQGGTPHLHMQYGPTGYGNWTDPMPFLSMYERFARASGTGPSAEALAETDRRPRRRSPVPAWSPPPFRGRA